MPARIRALLERVLEWWNKFSRRQKTYIIIGATAVVLTVAILAIVLTRPQYTHLYTAVTGSEVAQVRDILDEEGLDYQVTEDGRTFNVNSTQLAQANLALNANSIRSADWSITDVTTGGFSTTESDKNRLYVDFLEKKLAGDFIEVFDAIKSARVTINIPDNDGTLLSRGQESSAAILLEIPDRDAFTEDNAAYLARAVATALGNTTTDRIQIMATDGRMLYAGGSEAGSTGAINSQASFRSKEEQAVRAKVRDVLLATGHFSKVEVGLNLDIDFSDSKVVEHLYFAPAGQTQGVLAHQDSYEATNVAGVSGVPGTDPNDETTYLMQDNQTSNSTVEETSMDYLPNERVTESTSWGKIDMTTSTISVTATNYIMQNESDYNADDHDGMSWSEYKAANATPIPVIDDELTAQMRQLVANASGVSADNVALALYNENFFVDSTGMAIGITDILQVILIIVILLLLGFVILRSMRMAREEEEEEQELSVESLLESQPLDADLENIEMDSGSETKRLIEKFIDENPEAAAALLRNWLNEGYM
ncbi:MAG: flagellar M-ring protein FliF [Lachnospiraceae bacterium]|nr:flagellar M-ring protein FliF [Lachnospiraceae bacterium]